MSTIGTAFLIYYIFRASVDVVVSDYFRIINFYLEDVTDLHYLLSWEGICRIPFTFLARFINVKLFNYSVFFDKILGTFGLFLFNTIVLSTLLNNLKSKLMRCIASIFITYISFSLMAWEMILNGTGYAHFITVGLISLTFKIFANAEGIEIDQNANVKSKKYFPRHVPGETEDQSIISTDTFLPFLWATARMRMRICLTILPCRPMTLPMSPSATRTSKIVSPSALRSVTETWSGLSTRLCTI